MRELSVTEVKRKFGAAPEAAQQGPVLIKKQRRAVAVLLSAQEYDKLRRFGLGEFDRLCDGIAGKAAARGLDDRMFRALMGEIS